MRNRVKEQEQENRLKHHYKTPDRQQNTENHKLKQARFIVFLNCTLNYGQIILANNSHTNPYNNSTARSTVVLRNYRS